MTIFLIRCPGCPLWSRRNEVCCLYRSRIRSCSCMPCRGSLAHSYPCPFRFLVDSNHHAGNEWYRRLIKSNRPLYRACPKHTKLLVAKAVVQAVDQQGGRFLDKEKGSGLWYVVEYKRAVDKTSQGLRERERNGSDNDDDDDDDHDEMETTRTTMQDHDMSNPKADMTASRGRRSSGRRAGLCLRICSGGRDYFHDNCGIGSRRGQGGGQLDQGTSW
jgi:hypothetical protein